MWKNVLFTMWFLDFVTVFNQSYNCQTSHYLGRNRLPKPFLILPSLVSTLEKETFLLFSLTFSLTLFLLNRPKCKFCAWYEIHTPSFKMCQRKNKGHLHTFSRHFHCWTTIVILHLVKTGDLKSTKNWIQFFFLIKSSEIVFIFLPAFYPIIWLLASSKI